MWLSLIKSIKKLNQNFSNKSQNRIGFKFGFCTRLSILIIIFCSSLRLQWNWWRWKANKICNKYDWFECLLCQNRPAINDRKSGRILFQFELGLLPNLTMRLKYDFYEILRAFRACLLPINRPLSFKRMDA
jgi:hypothetical protein